MIGDNWGETPKAYVWMSPREYEDIKEGDIVSLSHKDGPETAMGRVVLKDEWSVMLNNRDEYFSLVDWRVSVLHRKD